MTSEDVWHVCMWRSITVHLLLSPSLSPSFCSLLTHDAQIHTGSDGWVGAVVMSQKQLHVVAV